MRITREQAERMIAKSLDRMPLEAIVRFYNEIVGDASLEGDDIQVEWSPDLLLVLGGEEDE